MSHPSNNIFENGEFERLCNIATQSVQGISFNPIKTGLSKHCVPTSVDETYYTLAPEKQTQVHNLDPNYGRAAMGPCWGPQFVYPIEYPYERDSLYELYKTYPTNTMGGFNMEHSQSASHYLPMAPFAQQINMSDYQPQQHFVPMRENGVNLGNSQPATEPRQHVNIPSVKGRLQSSQFRAPDGRCAVFPAPNQCPPAALTPANVGDHRHQPPPPFRPPTLAFAISTGGSQRMLPTPSRAKSPRLEESIQGSDSPQTLLQNEPLASPQLEKCKPLVPVLPTQDIIPVNKALVATSMVVVPAIEGFNSYSFGADTTLLAAAGSSDDPLASVHDYLH